jgi:hypothetical protein
VSFLNGALLWGALAISLPIIIHLINRQRFKTLRWAAIEFLLEANRRNRKRVQMEHLIVLLLRCLAIALIVAAVARPVATSGALAVLPGARDQVERIVIVDDSASTGEKEGDRTAFDEEKRQLLQLLTDLGRERPGDHVTIIRGSRPRRWEKAGRTDEEASEVARRIETWTPSDTRFPIADALREALASDHENEKADKTALKRYVYFLTDLRKCDWQADGGAATKEIHEAMKMAGTNTSFYIIDAGHDDTTNLGVVGLQPQEKLVATGIPQKLIAKVKNYGPQSAHEVRMQLKVGASAVPVAPISEIKPGETKDVEITYTFADAGPFAATVRLEGDRLPADDHRDVALEVVRAVRVLLVDGKPTDDAYDAQTHFLEPALAPPGDVKSGVETVTVPVERVAEEDISSYHAIILCDLDRFPAQRLPSLERYVREGGGLAIFLGDDVDPGAYERELWKQGAGLLPCKLGDKLGPFLDAPAKLSTPALDHPLLRIFSGENNPFLSSVKSRQHYALPIGPKDVTSRVIAKWEDVTNTPAIVEKGFGEGRVVLFNTTANRAWTDWPRQPSFPVFAQELVRHLAPASTKGANLLVGQPLQRAINPAVFKDRAKLYVPGEKTPHELLASRREQASDALWFSYPETMTAGVYQLELTPTAAGATTRTESFAVELDPREGELEKVDAEALQKILTAENTKVQISRAGQQSILALTEGERQELWRTCAFLLLVILALEGVLSFFAAHHGSAASADEIEAARRGGRDSGPRNPDAPVPMPSARSAPDAPVGLPVAGGRN